MAEYHLESGGEPEEELVLLNLVKKRKLCSKLLDSVYRCDNVKSPETSVSSAASVTYGCSVDDDDDELSYDVTKSAVSLSPDLEDTEGLETDISMAIKYCSRIQSSTPASDICGDSEQSSTPHAATPHRNSASSTSEEMPSAAEIEDFFAAAEKYEQKRFAEKYNYDTVEDVPLEGKYQWVPLHP